jgi:hypothetical protein
VEGDVCGGIKMTEKEYLRRLQSNRVYQRELEKYVEKMVSDVLKHEGIVLNEEHCSTFSVAQYLLIVGDNYSIYQWIKDTKENYPWSFKEV